MQELEIAASIMKQENQVKPFVADLDFNDVLYVAENMREEDRREIFATRFNESPHVLAIECMRMGHFAWTLGKERPIMVIGAVPAWPGVWKAWMFATDEFHKIGKTATWFAKNVIFPTLYECAHRVECASIEGNTQAQKWLEILGAKREAILKELGKNKEDFYLYVWRK